MNESFSELLLSAGIAPRETKVLRHVSPKGSNLYEVWLNDRPAFEAFQARQRQKDEPRFKRPVWASCIALEDGRTIFVGLYRRGTPTPLAQDHIDPVTHERSFSDNWHWYPTELMPELADLAGRVVVAWSSPRKWDQKAENYRAIQRLGDVAVDGGKQPGQRNAPWTRDELILALDFYLAHRPSIPGQNSEAVRGLSQLLNAMAGVVDGQTFRNSNGVYMKAMNFRRFDPEVKASGGVGLTRGNKDEQVVWDTFVDDPVRLGMVAQAIRQQIVAPEMPGPATQDLDDWIAEAPEGRILSRLHHYRERNQKLVADRKKRALKETGRLACEACDFEFEKRYGQRGYGYIEAHHTQALHTLLEGSVTKLEDLALLCANCHRMIHASKPWLALDDLRDLLAKASPDN